MLLWYFTKEDKCQFVLPDLPFVHQSGETPASKLLSEELRVNKGYNCMEGGSCPGLSTLYKTLFVWEHAIIGEGSFFLDLLFLTANFLM